MADLLVHKLGKRLLGQAGQLLLHRVWHAPAIHVAGDQLQELV